MPAAAPVEVTPDLKQTLKALNLTESEYQRIVSGLGRAPNHNELGMFSVLWSEHCCYKNSKHLLKKLPTTGPRILQGPGENAGVVDVGDGMAVAFKIESHNHPTAVEPFQGATTGVGGILRDIFTMNARPVANLNSLRFGPVVENGTEENRHNRYLFTHAVAGIGHYGNCVGVPTLAGEVFFDESYSENPLVNAMAVGMLYEDELMASGSKGVGNPVLYVGSATGKDGMGGAAFASRELDETSNEDRPAVQVGDPFAEKLLIESCLEAFATGAVVSAQDMGAAGLTCSAAEMSAKGGLGMRLDLDKVPAREPNMQAVEYLLSESQERMLMVLEKGREQEVMAIFERWGVPSAIVGEVTVAEGPQGGMVEFYHHGERVVYVPASLLTDDAPSYDRTEVPEEPAEAKARRERLPAEEMAANVFDTETLTHWLTRLFSSPNIARPTGVFLQYDRHVRNNTLMTSDQLAAGVIRLRRKDQTYSGKALAMTVDCNPRYVYLNPKEGAKGAVAEAARNLVCVGATPLAVTDNLNFGSPDKPNIYYQLYQSVEGLKEACLAFETPITGGNVSLYNEHSGDSIYPAPVVGMVGLIEDETKLASPQFKTAGDVLLLVGRFAPSLGGSEYQKLLGGNPFGEPPMVDLAVEKAAAHLVLSWVQQGTVQSVQDVSMGGLLVTAIECAFPTVLSAQIPSLGLSLNLEQIQGANVPTETLLFGETHGSYLVSASPTQAQALLDACDAAKVPVAVIGSVSATPTLALADQSIALQPMFDAWRTTLDF